MLHNNKPVLVEPGMKYFINETLKQCHKRREKYSYIIINVGLLILFIVIFAAIFIYKYKGKLSPYEKSLRTRDQYKYVLSQIQKVKNIRDQSNIQKSMFTDLPLWN